MPEVSINDLLIDICKLTGMYLYINNMYKSVSMKELYLKEGIKAEGTEGATRNEEDEIDDRLTRFHSPPWLVEEVEKNRSVSLLVAGYRTRHVSR